MKKLALFLIPFFWLEVSAQNTDSLLSSQYFESKVQLLDTTGFTFNKTYTETGTYWALDSFSETEVYHAELNYTNPNKPNSSYKLRVGKGGQIYSFIGAFGESVPPQWRNPNGVPTSYGGGSNYAPWVDEVWQMVAVDGALNNVPDSSYFIHQAGVYLKTPEQKKPFFSPVVAEYYNPQKQSYSIVNWGQQAHTEDLENIRHTSSILYYTTYTNKGNGIIQVDNMIYNFGNDDITFLNVPWGGVRNSSLDHFFISTPTNTLNLSPGQYGQAPITQMSTTGGYIAWSHDLNGLAPSLAMAHPMTTNTRSNVFRYGDAGNLSAPGNNRDYHVLEMTKQPRPGQLNFGKSMIFRYFYVLGSTTLEAQNLILQENLVKNSLDTAYIPQKTEVDSLEYIFTQTDSTVTFSLSAEGGLKVRTSPYSESFPLFKITSKEDKEVLTSNPYYFSAKAYDRETQSIKLLGFTDYKGNYTTTHDTICKGDNYTFLDDSALTDIQNSLTYVSRLKSASGALDSLVAVQIYVKKVNTQISKKGRMLIAEPNATSYQWLDCGNDFAKIDGATSSTFTTSVDGLYAVEILQNGCVDTSACYGIGITGIAETMLPNLKVFPNPTEGDLIIELGTKVEDLELVITDVIGREVYRRDYGTTEVVNLTIFEPNGVYLVKISSKGQKIAEFKVIKQ